MTRRLLLLFLLWTVPAWGQSTTHLWSPSSGVHPDFYGSSNFNTADVMNCFAWTPTEGLTNGTTMAFFMTGGAGGSNACSFTLYSADGTTQMATTGAINCGASGAKSVTGLTPFTIVQGTKYQVCNCVAVSGGTYAGADPGPSSGIELLQNALSGAPLATTAANGCTVAVPPATTGALSAVVADAPIVLFATASP
jgi:hypothetical protein